MTKQLFSNWMASIVSITEKAVGNPLEKSKEYGSVEQLNNVLSNESRSLQDTIETRSLEFIQSNALTIHNPKVQQKKKGKIKKLILKTYTKYKPKYQQPLEFPEMEWLPSLPPSRTHLNSGEVIEKQFVNNLTNSENVINQTKNLDARPTNMSQNNYSYGKGHYDDVRSSSGDGFNKISNISGAMKLPPLYVERSDKLATKHRFPINPHKRKLYPMPSYSPELITIDDSDDDIQFIQEIERSHRTAPIHHEQLEQTMDLAKVPEANSVLKKKKQSKDDVYHIEDILKREKRNHCYYYLVKWKNFDESENSWEHYSSFDPEYLKEIDANFDLVETSQTGTSSKNDATRINKVSGIKKLEHGKLEFTFQMADFTTKTITLEDLEQPFVSYAFDAVFKGDCLSL